MRYGSGRLFAWSSRFLLFVLAGAALLHAQPETALDRYVRAPDPAYVLTPREFKSYVTPTLLGSYSTFVTRLQTLKWRTRDDVEPEFWRHWLRIVVPSNPSRPLNTTAILIINGGGRDDPEPREASLELGLAAVTGGIVVAEVTAIPNQPLQFTDETAPRSEDAIIAYTWDKFLRTGEEDWPAQMPITKAAVRAMDAVQQFLEENGQFQHVVRDFIVGGGSKRAWTAWLAAAADPKKRVRAVAPIVFDALNTEESFRRHWRSYGFWSPAVSEYEDLGIFAWLGSRPSLSLMSAVDPLAYRDRLTMPKFIVNASGDEFFVPSAQIYMDGLPGPKYLRYVPNTDHGLTGAETDVIGGVVAWAQALIAGTPLPEYSWELPADGRIILRTPSQPSAVRLWQAPNTAARDFRRQTIGPAWTSRALSPSAPGEYQAPATAPPAGWTAYFIEAEFPGGLSPLKFTTPVRVAPDTFPFAPPLGTTLAASYDPRVAADAIASTFGTGLAGRLAVADRLPLPIELDGTRVKVIDANRVEAWAQLFAVAPDGPGRPSQVNFHIPVGASVGLGRIEVWRDGQQVSAGQLLIEPVAPGIFSANKTGEGPAAAESVTVKPDQSQERKLIFNDRWEAVPVSLSPAANSVYLVLYGTGMAGASTVTATVGGEPVGVDGPARSSEFIGLDQINLGPLPRTLSRRGLVDIEVIVDGIRANVVTVHIL
jgi:uncharacterized protein (TIGR03437 family)